MAEATGEDSGFHFLFRNDRGRINRVTWWRGTLSLVLIGLIATAGWLVVRPYTRDAIRQPPALAVLGYVYLMAFSFAVLVLLVCEYNLSAKRFAARGMPRFLAGALPLTLLFASAMDYYVPRSDGTLPIWTMWPVMLIVLAILVWNVVELGIRAGR